MPPLEAARGQACLDTVTPSCDCISPAPAPLNLRMMRHANRRNVMQDRTTLRMPGTRR